jgi:hypothetical protein
MKSECQNSERNKELKAFDWDGKQVIGRRVGVKGRKIFLDFLREVYKKKNKRTEESRQSYINRGCKTLSLPVINK